MKFKGYLLWFYLAIICDLFILYGWIKEIEWMIPTFFITSVIFATIAVSIELDNIKVINNLWDDLDSLKQKVSILEDKIDDIRLDDAKKQVEAEKVDNFDLPLCPYANTITRLKEKDEQEDYWKDKYPR